MTMPCRAGASARLGFHHMSPVCSRWVKVCTRLIQIDTVMRTAAEHACIKARSCIDRSCPAAQVRLRDWASTACVQCAAGG